MVVGLETIEQEIVQTKNCKDENGYPREYASRDLFGGDYYYWNNTPLIAQYNWHEANGCLDPVNLADRDVGELLKEL